MTQQLSTNPISTYPASTNPIYPAQAPSQPSLASLIHLSPWFNPTTRPSTLLSTPTPFSHQNPSLPNLAYLPQLLLFSFQVQSDFSQNSSCHLVYPNSLESLLCHFAGAANCSDDNLSEQFERDIIVNWENRMIDFAIRQNYEDNNQQESNCDDMQNDENDDDDNVKGRISSEVWNVELPKEEPKKIEDEIVVDFEGEYKSILSESIKKDGDVELTWLDLQLTRLDWKENIDECWKLIIDTMLEECKSNDADVMKTVQNLQKVFGKWSVLLEKIIETEDQEIQLIERVKEFCNREQSLRDAFHIVIQLLWNEGIIEDEIILEWAVTEEGNDANSHSLQLLAPFIAALKSVEPEENQE